MVSAIQSSLSHGLLMLRRRKSLFFPPQMECCRLRLLPNVLEWEGESISGAEEPRLVLVLGRRAFPCLEQAAALGLGLHSVLCAPRCQAAIC